MVDGDLLFMLAIQPFYFIGRRRETLQDNGWFEDGVKFFVGGMFIVKTKPNAIPRRKIKLGRRGGAACVGSVRVVRSAP